MDLRKFVSPEFIFGLNARSLVAQYALNLGAHHMLIVTDKGVLQTGAVDQLTKILVDSGLNYSIFSKVSANPRDTEIMFGAAFYKAEKCDLILSIGGGSVIDCAKGIGIIISNGGDILDYEGVDKIEIPMPPLICIPTTAGTSADVSQFAIINDSKRKTKIAIISKAAVPDISLIDPELLLTMDPFLTAVTGIDALVHAIEAYVSNASSSITDLHALQAIDLISDHLLDSIKQPDNLDKRSLVMQASLNAGLAFSNASLGATHALAHSLGGYLDLPHGECNALLLPHVIDFNFKSSTERIHKIVSIFGLDISGLHATQARIKIIDFFKDFINQAGIKDGLAKRGVSTSDLNILSKHAIDDPCIATNPRKANKGDLEVIYEESL